MSSLFVHQKIEKLKTVDETLNSEQWRHLFYDKPYCKAYVRPATRANCNMAESRCVFFILGYFLVFVSARIHVLKIEVSYLETCILNG